MRTIRNRVAGFCVPGLILLTQTCGALAQGTPAATLRTTMLPADLSVRGMFLKADIVVEAVLVGLILASIATWAVLVAKGFAVLAARRRIRRALAAAYAENNLGALQLRLQHPSPSAFQPDLAMLMAASDEMSRSASTERAGIKERIATRLHRIELGASRHLARGTGLLATIGATAPFVGLFGTVWGIMNSFIGISQAQTTNLAVVAPGIAEALLATAAGLVAAIPAVVIYNLFARGISGYRATLGDLSAAIQVLVSRDLDGQRATFKAAAE
jgi:biopolymer transport protein ExbB